MYRRLLLAAALPLLLLLTGCPQFTTPQQIHDQTEIALKPYFENVQVAVLENDATIIGFTCSNDLGPKMIDQIALQVQQLPDMQKLRTLRTIGGLLGNKTYKYFALGFDKRLISLDVDTWQISTIDGDINYQRAYRRVCQDDEQLPVAYIGRWDAIFTDASGQHERAIITDTLGVYRNGEFSKYKDTEISNRESLIRSNFIQRGYQLQSLSLVKVQHVVLRDNVTADDSAQ